MADEKKTNGTKTEAAAKTRAPRSANKPKSFGQTMGGILDMFEAFDPGQREKVLGILNAQYGSSRGPETFEGLGASVFNGTETSIRG
jgi:hypothetical protein